MEIAALYAIYQQHPVVTTDTRKLQPGCIFFCLKGPNFNGNLFAGQALEQGAAYVVADEPTLEDERILLVADVLDTLQQLALHHRRQFNIPFVAITGSNGKTTTKELVHAVLSSHFRAYTTQGNLNNHIGIPLTLLAIRPDAEIAVIEMGANHLKEIAGYCRYTLPTHGIITNCGKAHLEGFGGVEGVRKGKGELYDFLRANNGEAFAFDDYDYLHTMAAGIPVIHWYGTGRGEVTGTAHLHDSFLQVQLSKGLSVPQIDTQLVGEYNLPNVLCAVAVGLHFGVPEAQIVAAIESYAPSNSRSQLLRWGSNQVILDAYNANPSSVALAIDNFARLPGSEKIVLLGAMREMGEDSLAEHRQVIARLQQYNWKEVVLVGGDFAHVPHPYLYFDTAEAAGAWLKAQHLQEAQLLVKGSRGIQMEKVLQ